MFYSADNLLSPRIPPFVAPRNCIFQSDILIANCFVYHVKYARFVINLNQINFAYIKYSRCIRFFN